MRIGDVVFDPASGELTPAGGGAPKRLAPQPARLLALLAERLGQVVSRDEIRELLWPDVAVDFESGLHFCVRQVREALGDTASEPRYVETLPRRGYRLICEVEGVGREAGHEPHRGAGAGRPLSRRAIAMALVALVGALAIWVAAGRLRSRPVATPVRVAILPFRPPEAFPGAEGHADLAERLLASLDRRLDASVELIGPTTTGAWEADPTSLRALIAELEPAYLIHGRYLERSDGPALLGELIRAPDGAHVWVEAFEPPLDSGAIVRSITDGVAAYLGEPAG